MVRNTQAAFVAAFVTSQVLANPLVGFSHIFTLAPRAETGFTDCTDEQKERLIRAFNDARTLATEAQNIDTDSTAWTHYFREDGDGKDEDFTHAVDMWKAITDESINFVVRCGTDDEEHCKPGKDGTKSLAFTDARPESDDLKPELVVCPLFFSDSTKETKNDLDTRLFKESSRKQDDSWCAPGNKFSWYEVGGHTLMHEMTHFDAFGKKANFDE
jgi:hypothetical protein